MITDLIPWQQLEPVAAAPPGTWRSSGVEPQFRRVCSLLPGWIRIRLQMTSADRARAEIRIDTGAGLDDAVCVERLSFRGTIARHFYVKLLQPAYGIRLDPLDMEGEFRLEEFEVRSVSRAELLGRALWSALKQVRVSLPKLSSLRAGLNMVRHAGRSQLKRQFLKRLPGHSALAPPPYDAQAAYEAWRQRRALTSADRKQMRAEATALPNAPLVSILLPICQDSEIALKQTIGSVRRQIYPYWELCVASAISLTPSVRQLLEDAAEPRIRVLVGGTEDMAVNAALNAARGNYVMVLDCGDELADYALLRVAQAIAASPTPDLLYSDEDCLDAQGRHSKPFFKPDWSPEYLLSCMYIGRLAVYRADLVREVGGFRASFAAAHAYDLALRVAAWTKRIRHIADVLYHRRGSPDLEAGESPQNPPAEDAGRRAVASFLETTGQAGSVVPGPAPHTCRVRFVIKGRPLVSIILPTAYRSVTIGGENTTYLARCLASIRARTTWPNYEIILLDNDEVPPEVQKQLAPWGLERRPYPCPFNWAAAMNFGATRARGAHLLFLDDDTEILTPDWLECLLEYSQQQEIGAVGARLHFPDGRLQHAGVTVLNGIPGHPFYGEPESHPGYFYSSLVPRNYSAVTGACLMTRADVFHEVGGFDEDFAVNFNDIDYCLRVRCSSRRILCNPYARLIHYETATKASYSPTELNKFQKRWTAKGALDPFYNPNLSTCYHDFRVEA